MFLHCFLFWFWSKLLKSYCLISSSICSSLFISWSAMLYMPPQTRSVSCKCVVLHLLMHFNEPSSFFLLVMMSESINMLFDSNSYATLTYLRYFLIFKLLLYNEIFKTNIYALILIASYQLHVHSVTFPIITLCFPLKSHLYLQKLVLHLHFWNFSFWLLSLVFAR